MFFENSKYISTENKNRVDYTELVKTTITLPDALARKAERVARKMGISRNQLFVDAISEYLHHHQMSTITKKLNEVYSRESSDLDPVLYRMQLLCLKEQP